MKKVKGIEIYACSNCQLGFLDEKGLKKQRSLKISYTPDEYEKQECKLRRRFLELSEVIRLYKKSGRVLDLGAGFGLFASILQEKGYDLTVVEPANDPFYVKKGAKIYKKTFENFFKTNRQKFDVIIMMDIIEHLINPLQALLQAKSSLSEGGIIVIQTPNFQSLMAKMCKDWSWWMVEDHKFFFTPQSLSAMAGGAGLREVFSKTYEDFPDFKKNLDGNFSGIRNKFFKKAYKGIYFILFFSFYLAFRKFLWKNNFGGLIFSIYKKNV